MRPPPSARRHARRDRAGQQAGDGGSDGGEASLLEADLGLQCVADGLWGGIVDGITALDVAVTMRAGTRLALRYLTASDTVEAEYRGDARRGLLVAAAVVGAVVLVVGALALLTSLRG